MSLLAKLRWILAILICLSLGTVLFTSSITPGYAIQDSFIVEAEASQVSATMLTQMEPINTTIYLPLVANYWADVTPNFGVQFYGNLNAASGLDTIAEAGARWVRVPINWAAIEPVNTTPEHYNWTSLDLSIENATAHDINLVLILGGQPAWAAEYPMGPVYDTAELHEFLGALVERYSEVTYFEIYNEPDNASVEHAELGGFGYWGNNGTGYAGLLRGLYPVIKSANPEAQVVIGGLALDYYEDQGGIFVRSFLDDVLAACQGHDCFDVMNFHYYPPFRPNWEPYGRDIIGKANYVRQKLAEYGFESMPVICTEFSWSGGGNWGTDKLQSDYVVKGYVRTMAARLPIAIWFMKHDGGQVDLPGLLDRNLQPKPAYYAYQVMTQQLQHAIYQRPLNIVETGSSSMEGYIFQVGRHRMDVVWTEGSTWNSQDAPVLPYTVTASRLLVIDKWGNEVLYTDAQDDVMDQRITIMVDDSPLYLVYEP